MLQRYGEGYWETYASVTSNRAIKLLLAITASNGIKHKDASNGMRYELVTRLKYIELH